MKLPFIKESKWPVMREEEERVANPSHDTQLQEHLVDELMAAMEGHELRHKTEAIIALIRSILNEEHDEV